MFNSFPTLTMTPLRFRAWHKKGGVMSGNVFDLSHEIFSERQEDWIVMRSTGLKDKNGVEIFEGDILEFQSTVYDDIRSEDIAVVEFIDGAFVPNGKNSRKLRGGKWVKSITSVLPWKQYAGDWKIRCEVIGNIYESPQLLSFPQ